MLAHKLPCQEILEVRGTAYVVASSGELYSTRNTNNPELYPGVVDSFRSAVTLQVSNSVIQERSGVTARY